MTNSVFMNIHVINISSFHTLISVLSVKKNFKMLFKTVLQFLTAKLMLLKNAKFHDFVFHGLFLQGSFQYYDVKPSVNRFLEKKLFLLLLITSTVICNF